MYIIELYSKYTFLLHCTESVTGGARAEGILDGLLTIEDSDEVYGVVEFDMEEEQLLDIVRIFNEIS